jgi:hypothetical protein
LQERVGALLDGTPVARRLGLGPYEIAVQRTSGPGIPSQTGGFLDHRVGRSGDVDVVVGGWEVANPGFLADADVVLGVDGDLVARCDSFAESASDATEQLIFTGGCAGITAASPPNKVN